MGYDDVVGNTLFASDIHFCHPYVALIRGFASPQAHDEEVIARWNARVRPEDVVWVPGDIGMGNPRKFLPLVARLNGTKHLVSGNHDAVWPGHRDAFKRQREWLEFFASVQPFARKRIAGHDVLLSHFPYHGGGDHTPEERHAQYRLHDEDRWLLHGHTHWKHIQWHSGRSIHVGLDAWDLKPVPLATVEKIIMEAEEQAAA